jgi:hypothetical protein
MKILCLDRKRPLRPRTCKEEEEEEEEEDLVTKIAKLAIPGTNICFQYKYHHEYIAVTVIYTLLV